MKEETEAEALTLMMATMKHNRLRPRIESRSSSPQKPLEKTSHEIDSVQPPCSFWSRAVPLVEALRWVLLVNDNLSPIKPPDRKERKEVSMEPFQSNGGILGLQKREYRLRLYPEFRLAPLRIQS